MESKIKIRSFTCSGTTKMQVANGFVWLHSYLLSSVLTIVISLARAVFRAALLYSLLFYTHTKIIIQETGEVCCHIHLVIRLLSDQVTLIPNANMMQSVRFLSVGNQSKTIQWKKKSREAWKTKPLCVPVLPNPFQQKGCSHWGYTDIQWRERYLQCDFSKSRDSQDTPTAAQSCQHFNTHICSYGIRSMTDSTSVAV